MVGRRTGASSSLWKARYSSRDTVISTILYLSIWTSVSFINHKAHQKLFGLWCIMAGDLSNTVRDEDCICWAEKVQCRIPACVPSN
uniref:Uncharacterized protein n=1 Tax=Salix viminalis TaxID=40686 RepID=A0A6N2MAI8_SALVM